MNRGAEQALIASLLTDVSMLASLEVNPGDFSDNTMGLILGTIRKMVSQKQSVDEFSVCDELQNTTGQTWDGHINKIRALAVSPAHAQEYARQIATAARTRKATRIANDLIIELSNGNSDHINQTIRELVSLDSVSGNHECSLDEALEVAISDLEAAFHRKGEIAGVTSGLADLDKATSGFNSSDLIVVGARPAMGKTALMLNFGASAISSGKAVGLVSAEQGRNQIAARLLAIKGRANAAKMRSGMMTDDDWGQINAGLALLKQAAEMRMNDKPGISISDCITQARQWKQKHDINALYLDYIQKIKPSDTRMPRHEQVGEIVTSLKDLAKELDIPVIALAQVNRTVEGRENKRPNQGDLKESGTIEQEADQIIMLYRDEVYDPETKDKGIAELDVTKNRHGPTGMIRACWSAASMLFLDFARGNDEHY